MAVIGSTRVSSPRATRLTRVLNAARATLWASPVAAVLLALAVGLALAGVRPEAGGWGEWFWPGDVQSALSLLQSVMTATMAATTLTFSVTVVALQLASQQFSPRLLREFARDPLAQATLAVLVATFVVSLVTLRAIDELEPLPALSLGLVQVLALASVIALVMFLGHVVRILRVDTMMLAVHSETAATLDETYPDRGDMTGMVRPDLPGPEGGTLVNSPRSGFVRTVHWDRLVDAATAGDAFIRMGARPGDHVTEGTPVLAAWSTAGGDIDVDALSRAADEAIEFGFERTIEQDAALGFRQLTDIAVKAISPGVNDPVTAVHAIGYCAQLMRTLEGKRLGPRQ